MLNRRFSGCLLYIGSLWRCLLQLSLHSNLLLLHKLLHLRLHRSHLLLHSKHLFLLLRKMCLRVSDTLGQLRRHQGNLCLVPLCCVPRRLILQLLHSQSTGINPRGCRSCRGLSHGIPHGHKNNNKRTRQEWLTFPSRKIEKSVAQNDARLPDRRGCQKTTQNNRSR